MELNSTEDRLQRELEPFKPVIAALKKAEEKHPTWPVGNMYKQACILGEESGEVLKAVLKYHDEAGSLSDIKNELYQTAAMCMRMLKHIDASAEHAERMEYNYGVKNFMDMSHHVITKK